MRVSIAENLNCDYSDVSDLQDDGPSYDTGTEDNCFKTDEASCNNITPEQTGSFIKDHIQEFVLNLIFLILFLIFKIMHFLYQLPVIFTVILVIFVLIKCYL